jgi:hypothetical protein
MLKVSCNLEYLESLTETHQTNSLLKAVKLAQPFLSFSNLLDSMLMFCIICEPFNLQDQGKYSMFQQIQLKMTDRVQQLLCIQ